jgi:hypothetical protein
MTQVPIFYSIIVSMTFSYLVGAIVGVKDEIIDFAIFALSYKRSIQVMARSLAGITYWRYLSST